MAEKSNGKAVSSQSRRFMKLAGMTASAAGHVTRNRLKSALIPNLDKEAEREALYRKLGKEIVATLGELKGAAMKIGQVISQMEQMLPEPMLEELVKLQNQAPAMDFAVIEQQIQAELGFPPEKLFATFEREPFAAASIGQVHRATTWEDEEVVVKVQYPGVQESCESDMQHLKRLLRLGGLLKVDKAALDDVFDEIYYSLLEELDYQKEAENLRYFRSYHERHPGIVIPEVKERYTSERVLTVSYEPGDSLVEVAKNGYPSDVINRIGQTILELVIRQIHELKAIHSDPHPGNFAVRPDGSLVIYDFGCVTYLEDDIVNALHQVTEAALQFDYAKLDSAMLTLGVRNAGVAEVGEAFYKPWLDIIVAPLMEQQDYAFGQSLMQDELMQQRDLVWEYWQAFQPSANTLYVNRVLSGHYFNLVQMGATLPALETITRLLNINPKRP